MEKRCSEYILNILNNTSMTRYGLKKEDLTFKLETDVYLEFLYKVQSIFSMLLVAGSCVFNNVYTLDSYIPDQCLSYLQKQPILTGKMESHLHKIYYIVCFDTFLQKACYMEQKIYNLFYFSM